MPKSRIGPFALEAPLSPASPSGQVFRGIHIKQKKLAALRVFPIPMGMTPESRQAFAGELEQLKQLRHPHIVRCYGGGFDTRQAYLAYSLVEGESLEKLLERRGRIPWDTALDYSKQLAQALQYSHQMGWIHGRLQPQKILVGEDGIIKVADWRREAVTTALGARKPSLTQLLFTAPECLDAAPADEKSDLYSVGALMYLMLTGNPPFTASEAELAEVVRTGTPPEVGTIVLDCPVWLSAIVTQLLSKNPADRPYSATALQLAFKEAERRQAEGVGVLQHAAAGFSPLRLNTDRAEAEKVLGIKPTKKRRKHAETSLLDQTWVLLVGLAGAIAAIVWFLLPLSEATLRQRAEALLPPESDQWQEWYKSRDDYLEQLVVRFPNSGNAEWAREQIEWVNAREYERRLEREERLNRQDKWSDADRQLWKAREYEQFGDLLSAMDRFRALIAIYSDAQGAESVVFLASEGVQRVRSKGRVASQLQDYINGKLEEADQAYANAQILAAREIWESIVELYSDNAELLAQVEIAQGQLDSLRDR